MPHTHPSSFLPASLLPLTPVFLPSCCHVSGPPDWSLQDLGRVTGVSSDVVAKKMMLWVNQGVVAMGPSGGTATTYSLITQQEAAPQVSSTTRV